MPPHLEMQETRNSLHDRQVAGKPILPGYAEQFSRYRVAKPRRSTTRASLSSGSGAVATKTWKLLLAYETYEG